MPVCVWMRVEMGVDSYVLEMVQFQVFLLIRSGAMLLLVPELCTVWQATVGNQAVRQPILCVRRKLRDNALEILVN